MKTVSWRAIELYSLTFLFASLCIAATVYLQSALVFVGVIIALLCSIPNGFFIDDDNPCPECDDDFDLPKHPSGFFHKCCYRCQVFRVVNGRLFDDDIKCEACGQEGETYRHGLCVRCHWKLEGIRLASASSGCE